MGENMQDATTNDRHHADAVNGGEGVGWTLEMAVAVISLSTKSDVRLQPPDTCRNFDRHSPKNCLYILQKHMKKK
jgi:hypothetical protein